MEINMESKLKILVVDDEENMRFTLSTILKKVGDVETAQDGYKAIELAKDNKFNIILMDVKMPGINGVETYLEIKKFSPNTAVIMMTAYSVEDLLEQAVNEGAYAVIYKPFDVRKIMDHIDKLYKPVVLITDDDENFTISLQETMRKEGYNVDIAFDGKKTIEKIKENSEIDIILLDVKMPEFDGIQTFEEIKKINPMITVIMMTGYSVSEMLERALNDGAYTCIYKPFDIGKIVNTIKEIRK